MSDLEVTPIDQWNSPRKQGFLVRLPNGNVCRVRRIGDLRYMLQTGRVPNPLIEFIQKSLDEGKVAADLSTLGREKQIAVLDLIDRTVVEVMIEPKVAIPPDEDEEGNMVDANTWMPPPGHISMMDLTMEDKLFLYQVALGGATDVGMFRSFQSGLVASVPTSSDVPLPAERAPRTKRAGSGSKRKP